jgi:hypothetical protein
VRVVDLPLVLRAPSLPDMATAPRGAKVRLNIEEIDLLTAEIRARFVEVLAAVTPIAALSAGDDALHEDTSEDTGEDASEDASLVESVSKSVAESNGGAEATG